MIKKIIAVAVVFVFALCLVSCAPYGEYYSVDKTIKYEFGISSVSMDRYVGGEKQESIKGTYEIDDNQITIFYENENGEDMVVSKYYEEIDDNSIKIDNIVYYKEP